MSSTWNCSATCCWCCKLLTCLQGPPRFQWCGAWVFKGKSEGDSVPSNRLPAQLPRSWTPQTMTKYEKILFLAPLGLVALVLSSRCHQWAQACLCVCACMSQDFAGTGAVATSVSTCNQNWSKTRVKGACRRQKPYFWDLSMFLEAVIVQNLLAIAIIKIESLN